MYLKIRFSTDGSMSGVTNVADVDATYYARGTLFDFKQELPHFDDCVFADDGVEEEEFFEEVLIGNSIVWDAFKLLLATEFRDLFKKVKWFVGNEEVTINEETFSESKFFPELGTHGTILVELLRARRKIRDKEGSPCSETTQ